jgi:tetratricopeptide (TPR) repeat protein
MYLKGSRWSMMQRRKRTNPLRVAVLTIAVAVMIYINQVIVPDMDPLFIPTPTPTRAPDSFLVEAQDLVQAGKINQAMAAYEEAVKADPRNPSTYVTLARWQVLYGNYEGAIDNVENALLINPNHALAMAVRGWALAKQKEYEQALVVLEDALRLDNNSALAWAYLAELYLDMINANRGDPTTPESARTAASRARELDPNLLEVRRVRGLVLEFNLQPELAVQEYEAAIAMNEYLPELYVLLGRSYRNASADNVGYSERSVTSLLRAIALDPESAKPYAELAITYLNIGEHTKGVQIAQEAVKRAPEDPYQHAMLGTMFFRTLQYGEAVPEFRLALRGGRTAEGIEVVPIPLDPLNPTSVIYFSRFGIALAYTGQCGESVTVAQELLSRLPTDPNVAYNTDVMFEECRGQASGSSQ